MKQLLLIACTFLSVCLYAQDKYNYVQFNKLKEVEGTNYIIATIVNAGKMFTVHSQYLLFINTLTGQTKQVDFRKDAYLEKMEQFKNDTLGINQIIIAAKSIDLDGRKGIDWNDPKQIIVLSADGQQRTQLTDDKYFVITWITNKQTGTIVITGYYDSNNNGKYDKTDKNEILIYDLKTLKLISKI